MDGYKAGLETDFAFPSKVDDHFQGPTEGRGGGVLLPCLADPESFPRAGILKVDDDGCPSPDAKRMAVLGTWSTPTCVLEPAAFSSPSAF